MLRAALLAAALASLRATRLAHLFRTITAPDEIRDVQHDANPAGPTERRCEEAMHLSQRHGGAGWTHPRLVAPAASTGRVMDVLYLLRRLEDVSPLVPPPSEWATSGVPLLEERNAWPRMGGVAPRAPPVEW